MTGDAPFHQTRIGQVFYERTMPALVQQLARLADVLERLADQGSAIGATGTTPPDGDRGSESAPRG